VTVVAKKCCAQARNRPNSQTQYAHATEDTVVAQPHQRSKCFWLELQFLIQHVNRNPK